MPYYNSYQQSYQPYQQNFQSPIPNYSQVPQYSATPTPQQNSGILWVQGEVGARAYPVAPGSSVLLMDSEAQNFYIKSADMSGMPTMKKYSYAEMADEPMRLESHDANDYDTSKLASRDEVKKLQEEIQTLKSQLETMKATSQKQENKGGKQNA